MFLLALFTLFWEGINAVFIKLKWRKKPSGLGAVLMTIFIFERTNWKFYDNKSFRGDEVIKALGKSISGQI
jgi:hypothetical protein